MEYEQELRQAAGLEPIKIKPKEDVREFYKPKLKENKNARR